MCPPEARRLFELDVNFPMRTRDKQNTSVSEAKAALATCEIRTAEQFNFTNLSRNTVFVCVLCCRCVIFKISISPRKIQLVDAFWYVLTYTLPLSPTHLHEKTSAQAQVGSPAEKPSGTKPTGLGTRTGF